MIDDEDDDGGDEEKDSDSRELNDDTANLYIKNEEKTAPTTTKQKANKQTTTTATAAAGASTAASAASSSTSASSSAASAAAPAPVDLSAPFHLLPTTFSKDTPPLRNYWTKWNIDPTCCMLRFRFAQVVDLNDPSSLHAFLVGFVNSQAFRENFRCYDSSSRSMRALSPSLLISKVNFSGVKTTQLDLHFFDRLWTEDPAIVYGSLEDPIPELSESMAGAGGREGAATAGDDDRGSYHSDGNGSIRKCFEDVVDGITISDELRKMLLDRDSDHYDLYSPGERQELLFQLLLHVSIGGGMNQYENNVGPYLAAIKALYKDILAVKTNRNTNALEVASLVYKVTGIAGTDSAAAAAASAASGASAGVEKPVSLFGSKPQDKHHCFYLSVDPQKRQITCYYFAHTAAW